MSDYIKEMGIDSTKATPETEAEVNNTEDFVQDSNTEESKVDTDGNTEPNISDGLQKQIDGLEKRIADKDDYINTLREQSKAQEAEVSGDVDTETDDFWDDPEAKFNDMRETMRIQQMQIGETQYANTVENYWKTVNQEALKTAVATDADFADTFNSSNEPFRVAYEYLSKKTEAETASKQSLRDEIKAELLKEMGIDKPKKEAIPNMGDMGGKSSDKRKSNASDDGFASVFGNN